MKTPEVCPVCGADVPRNAKACPECGADERSGWSENAVHDGLDLSEEDFDYDKFVEEEFGGSSSKIKPRGLSWFWWIAALILIAALLFLFL